MKTINILANCIGAIGTTVAAVTVWILSSNIWNDYGFWIDSETWND